jgi:predicted metalloprotease with PDZ domain
MPANCLTRHFLLVCLALTPILAHPAPIRAQGDSSDPIRVSVDATEAPRRFLCATLLIPAKPGPLTLYYPKWVPGEHGPTGPINDLAGLKITAAGKPVAWQRDEVDMYAFHCDVPAGADYVEVSLNFLAPPSGAFSSGSSTSDRLAVLSWNQLVVYPKGPAARDLRFQASVRLPKGWKLAGALTSRPGQGDLIEFDPVPLETLVDTPMQCGEFQHLVPIGPPGGPKHAIAIAADSPTTARLDDAFKADLDRLVDEAGRLFGSRPYPHYTFLLTLSDKVAHFGLEHHESSDNRGPERLLADDRIRKSMWGMLLPHEFVHAWNGKYRRPRDMITDDYQQPQRTKLLWVYEGLTQYLGVVLTTRSGIWTPEQFRGHLAGVGAWAKNQRGRSWRPLEDTTVAAQLLYGARGDWGAWRRGVDFYDEGTLLWLDVDTLIREKTGGKKSLDDFCRRFFAHTPSDPHVKPYTIEDVVADLNAVAPHDWKGFLAARTATTNSEPPLDGISRGGWKLVYGEKPTEFLEANEGETKTLDFASSLGLLLREDGQVADVIPGTAAHKAGVGPGMRVVAVNSRRFSPKVLRDALVAEKKDGLALMVENGDYFHLLKLAYTGGARYPALERDPAAPDLIAAITQPLAPQAPPKAGATPKK